MPDIVSANLVKEVAAKKDLVAGALVTVTTTAALAAASNAINTTGKYQGKVVFNTTTNTLMVATGTTPTSTWTNAGTGSATTPA